MSEQFLNNISSNDNERSFDNRGRIVPLSEQTIRNSFLFGAVMLEGTNCKELLQIILGKEISKVDIIYEKSIVYHPEYKGIRMDVYAKGEDNVSYNIEMQICTEKTELRSRYYHSQMDMELLSAGDKYKELPETYVIFICNYDPLGYNKYVYTIDSKCTELPEYEYYDGRHTIFLSTRGRNADEVPEDIVTFLRFVDADLESSREDFGNDFIARLQSSIDRIKHDREYMRRYNTVNDIFSEGKKIGITEGRDTEKRDVAFRLFKNGTDYQTVVIATGMPYETVDAWHKEYEEEMNSRRTAL